MTNRVNDLHNTYTLLGKGRGTCRLGEVVFGQPAAFLVGFNSAGSMMALIRAPSALR